MDSERQDRLMKVLRYAAAGAAVLAAAALVLSLLLGGEDEKPESTKPEKKLITRLPKSLRAEAIRAAKEDGTVKRVVGNHTITRSQAAPWVAEGGTELLGASVRLHLQQQLRLEKEKLPAYITPSRQAPPSTPNLRRYARFSGTGITELRVLMRLPSREVLEVAPEGPGASLATPELIGPPVGKAYRETGGY